MIREYSDEQIGCPVFSWQMLEMLREMLEMGSDDIGSDVCYTISNTIYLNLWTQAADPISF